MWNPLSALGGVLGGAGAALKGGLREVSGDAAAAEEAGKNRGFQERMRNTSYQAAVADMEAAGLNPALAYQQGGAASPGGSMAAQKGPLAAVTTAMELKRLGKSLKLLDSQIAKTTFESNAAHSDSVMRWVDEKESLARYDYFFNPNGTPKGPFKKLLQARFDSSVATSARDVSMAEVARFSIPEQKAIARLFSEAGSGAKGIQMMLPLLTALIRR